MSIIRTSILHRARACLTQISVCCWCAALAQVAHAAETQAPSGISAAKPQAISRAASALLYSIAFPGGTVETFIQFWQTNALSSSRIEDNFVVSARVRELHVPAFTLRNARLGEVARSIEFLTDGAIRVEVTERTFENEANTWRLGSDPSQRTDVLKMRAVAAPKLSKVRAEAEEIAKVAEELERRRTDQSSAEMAQRGLTPRPGAPCWVTSLHDQRVFVIVGSDEAVAGIESFIQAAEQSAAARPFP